jgi:hypothetical protein
VDITINELPADAQKCGDGSVPSCGWHLMMLGVGHLVHSGEQYRIFVFDVVLPNLAPQQLLITQNLGVPGAPRSSTALRSCRRPSGPARHSAVRVNDSASSA